MEIDIEGILTTVIFFGLLSIAGAGMGFVLFIFFMMIKHRTIDTIAIGSEISDVEIGGVMLLGAIGLIVFFIIQYKRGNTVLNQY